MALDEFRLPYHAVKTAKISGAPAGISVFGVAVLGAGLGLLDSGLANAAEAPARVRVYAPGAKAEVFGSAGWVFVEPGESGVPRLRELTRKDWDALSAEQRRSFLEQAFLVNAPGVAAKKSSTTQKSCFNGPAATFAATFFGRPSRTQVAGFSEFELSLSSDDHLIGLGATAMPGGESFHFRLPSCDFPSKSPFLAQLQVTERRLAGSDRLPASEAFESSVAWIDSLEEAPASLSAAQNDPLALAREGFAILDPGPTEWPKGKPRFALAADYAKAGKAWQDPAQRPWKNMDLRDPKQREKFAALVLEYFYVGMVDQSIKDPELILDPAKNKERAWCHMPWLNVGDNGREVFHGLTRERDLEPSPIYPNAPWGSDWGVGFYNAPGCRSLENIWGTKDKPKAVPSFAKSNYGKTVPQAFFADGTMAVKVLFTTADFSALDGTLTWTGHVNPKQNSTVREVAPVRLLQIDIAVKDTTLGGTYADIDHWVMTTYYYDKSYEFVPSGLFPKSRNLKAKAHPGWLRMRPVGVQLGLGTPEDGHSFIFADAKTNGAKGRLNGPADNPKSSCLTCHGAAGASPFVTPGIVQHSAYQAKAATALEFSQQLALAKRNYETRARRRR
jgi:hypothetical protein